MEGKLRINIYIRVDEPRHYHYCKQKIQATLKGMQISLSKINKKAKELQEFNSCNIII